MSETERVYKYVLNKPEQTLDIPLGAELLCVANQNNNPAMWMQVNPDAPTSPRTYTAVPTGGEVGLRDMYLGTVHGIEGWMVFHIYEVGVRT